jgi:DNA-binding NtrC family response regulator
MHAHLLAAVAGMIACSSSMIEAVRLARSYARSRDPMLLVGPTGSGKSRLARLVHLWSGRPGRMAEVSARELQGSLGYDQLFGHERGAYTDAVNRRLGVFAEAGSGTVLVDDAHLLEPATQMMLLRALDSGVYRPLGSNRDVPIHARLLVGTQRDADDLVRDGTWLPDFRHRLGFFEIRLDPLQLRREDVIPLVEEFLRACAREEDADAPLRPHPDLLPVLEAAPWPGNVRELERTVRFAHWSARTAGAPQVGLEHLPPRLHASLQFDSQSGRETKERLVAWALRRTGGHVGRAAELIRAHRNTVSAIRAELELREAAGALHNESPMLVQSAADHKPSPSGRAATGSGRDAASRREPLHKRGG